MSSSSNRKKILIAGGGIAGLTSAICLSDAGFEVSLFERAPAFTEVGAGLQLSPNATRILDSLGMLEDLLSRGVEPDRVRLRSARKLNSLAEVDLGETARKRWGAPYLTIHRADLLAVLVGAAGSRSSLNIISDREVTGYAFENRSVLATVKSQGKDAVISGDLLIAADGVWSCLRKQLTGNPNEGYSGYTAWRKTVPADAVDNSIISPREVTAFLDPHGHLVAYPVSSGNAINLVAFARGVRVSQNTLVPAANNPMMETLSHWNVGLRRIMNSAGDWIGWPIHAVDIEIPWTDSRGLALIGDAAHAMTPFSAQGAVMAIEDAATLAALLEKTGNGMAAALAQFEKIRKPRAAQVAARGRFNRFTWHAAGPVALVRNLILKSRSGDALAADMDAIYGYHAASASDINKSV